MASVSTNEVFPHTMSLCSADDDDIIMLLSCVIVFSRHILYLLPLSSSNYYYYLYRDYSRPWPISGCVQVADCDSPGYADQVTCCAAQYGGQTGGACSSVVTPTANPNIGKYYADYSTPWPAAGCKDTLPHPISAAVFYATQLECCKGAFGGQTSGACIKGLPNPPTLIPTITTVAGQGGGWYADYNTAWSNAGCKNALPLPNHAIIVYISQLECCKGAYNGQISNACIKGLPNPPTSMPTIAPTTVAPTTKLPTTLAGLGGGWYADYGTTWPNAGCKKPPHCQSMPPCSTQLSWRAARVLLEDRQVTLVLWDFQTLPLQSHRLPANEVAGMPIMLQLG